MRKLLLVIMLVSVLLLACSVSDTDTFKEIDLFATKVETRWDKVKIRWGLVWDVMYEKLNDTLERQGWEIEDD